MKILYDNQTQYATTTITPSSEDSNFPFSTALLDPRMSRSGRTLGIISENIVFYNASGFTFSDVMVAKNNLTDSAVVKFQANATDVWTSPSVDVTLTKLNNDYYYYTGTLDSTGYLYCRILITDPTNTESYMKISKIYIGEAIIMPGIDPTMDLPIISNSTVTQNETGQIFADKKTQLKGASVKFPVVTEAQRQQILTMFETVDITDPFFLLIWESSLTTEPPLYATLTNAPTFKKLVNLLWSLDFSFIENK